MEGGTKTWSDIIKCQAMFLNTATVMGNVKHCKKITVYGKSANNFMRQNHREVFEK